MLAQIRMGPMRVRYAIRMSKSRFFCIVIFQLIIVLDNSASPSLEMTMLISKVGGIL